jgi:hypothetical protein
MDPTMARLEMLDKEALKRRLQSRPGYKYDQAGYLIEEAEYLFSLTVCDERVFRNLIPNTWVLEENERPRTLERLVGRLLDRGLTWARLAASPPPVQQAEWYQRVQKLYDEFDWGQMGQCL